MSLNIDADYEMIVLITHVFYPIQNTGMIRARDSNVPWYSTR